jgi:hypothetical protein
VRQSAKATQLALAQRSSLSCWRRSNRLVPARDALPWRLQPFEDGAATVRCAQIAVIRTIDRGTRPMGKTRERERDVILPDDTTYAGRTPVHWRNNCQDPICPAIAFVTTQRLQMVAKCAAIRQITIGVPYAVVAGPPKREGETDLEPHKTRDRSKSAQEPGSRCWDAVGNLC